MPRDVHTSKLFEPWRPGCPEPGRPAVPDPLGAGTPAARCTGLRTLPTDLVANAAAAKRRRVRDSLAETRGPLA